MTKVKVCGITNVDDARAAVRLGAWAIGLIFHAESPRAVDRDTAEAIGTELKRSLEVTGVFVNAPLDEVAAMADRCSLSMLQLHGDEGPAYCREIARRTGCKVMKAARVKDGASLRALEPYHVDFHLVDAHVHGKPGGTGERFDWELVKDRRHPVPLVLSGGLTPGNVADGVRAARPYAVDTASGTEGEEPGRKDPAKLEAFFEAVRSVPGGDQAAA